LAGQTCDYASVTKRRGPIAGISRILERKLATLQAFLGFVLQAYEAGDGTSHKPLASLASEFIACLATTTDTTRLAELQDRYEAELGGLNGFDLSAASDRSNLRPTTMENRNSHDKLHDSNRLEAIVGIPSQTESESETSSDPGNRQTFSHPSLGFDSEPVSGTTWPLSILATDFSPSLRVGGTQRQTPESIFPDGSAQTRLRIDPDIVSGRGVLTAGIPTSVQSTLEPFPQAPSPTLDFPELAFADSTFDIFDAIPFGAAFDLDYDAMLS